MPIDQLVKTCTSDGVELFKFSQFNAPAREFMDFTTGQGQVFADFLSWSEAARANHMNLKTAGQHNLGATA